MSVNDYFRLSNYTREAEAAANTRQRLKLEFQVPQYVQPGSEVTKSTKELNYQCCGYGDGSLH